MKAMIERHEHPRGEMRLGEAPYWTPLLVVAVSKGGRGHVLSGDVIFKYEGAMRTMKSEFSSIQKHLVI